MAQDPEEWDLQGDALLGKLESDGTGAEQLRLVRACLDFYESAGVISQGRALRLDRNCPRCDQCWAGLGDEERLDDQHAGVSVPFVGSDYQRYGIPAGDQHARLRRAGCQLVDL